MQQGLTVKTTGRPLKCASSAVLAGPSPTNARQTLSGRSKRISFKTFRFFSAYERIYFSQIPNPGLTSFESRECLSGHANAIAEVQKPDLHTCSQPANIGENDLVRLIAAEPLPHLFRAESGVEDLGVDCLLPDVYAFAAAVMCVELLLQATTATPQHHGAR